MKTINYGFLFLAVSIIIAACSSSKTETKLTGPVTADEIKGQIAVIANDSLMGRKPFTVGETKAINYIASQFKKLGLEPGNNGSYFQDVPMVEIKSTPTNATISGKTNLTLKPVDDFVALSRREQDTIQLKNSPLVFAGYGVVAPEYHWNDYAGLDVKGKTVVVLVNDPGFKSGNGSYFFKGDTMTYYGRWTYKFEEAARQGAAGVIIVHQTDAASYGWPVIKNSNTGARLYLQQKDKHMSRCKMEGWMTEDVAKKLLAGVGITGDIRKFARKKDFKAVPLGVNFSVNISNTIKYAMSHNVIATLKGTTQASEAIIYTAHWDHFGVGPAVKGDSIYNGAVDNGSGVAALISVAKAFTLAKDKPKRSIVFLSVTSEEQGLLGSEYYATHPVFPLNKTVADLNMDMLGNFGETKDLAITGKGQNDLDDYVAEQATIYGLTVVGDTRPSAGSYYRSDHFNFAKLGVPALDMNNGSESVTHGSDWGRAQRKEFNDQHYHQVSDNYTPDMDATGMAEVANILYNVGYKLSNETTFPGWKPKSEFKAVRDKAMGK